MPKIFQKCPKGALEKVERAFKGMPISPQVSLQGFQYGIKSPKGATRGYKDDPAGSSKQARGSPKGALARKSSRRQQIALGVWTDLELKHEKPKRRYLDLSYDNLPGQ